MHADITPTLLDLLGLWKPEKERPSRPQERSDEALLTELQQKQKQEQEQKDALQDGGGDSPSRGNNESPGSVATRSISAPGSGLIGDSLLGHDYRGCAVSATHYGGKTLAVVAGDWKGLFLYRWEKQGDVTHAEVRRF